MDTDYRSLILFAGEKFRLVPFDLSFTDTLFEAIEASRPELSQWLPWCRADYDIEACRHWLETRQQVRLQGQSFDFAITDAVNGELVGACGINQIHPDHRMGLLYYWVKTSRTSEGAAFAAASTVADFALNRLHLIRVEIFVAEGNSPAERVAEKIGASREVLLRNRMILNEQIHHVYLFSRLGSIEKPERPGESLWVRVSE